MASEQGGVSQLTGDDLEKQKDRDREAFERARGKLEVKEKRLRVELEEVQDALASLKAAERMALGGRPSGGRKLRQGSGKKKPRKSKSPERVGHSVTSDCRRIVMGMGQRGFTRDDLLDRMRRFTIHKNPNKNSFGTLIAKFIDEGLIVRVSGGVGAVPAVYRRKSKLDVPVDENGLAILPGDEKIEKPGAVGDQPTPPVDEQAEGSEASKV